MKKNIKNNKTTDIEDVKKTSGGEEETDKESSTLSDGVLDAFDEVAPVDPLLEEEEVIVEEDEDDIDSGDYKPLNEW